MVHPTVVGDQALITSLVREDQQRQIIFMQDQEG